MLYRNLIATTWKTISHHCSALIIYYGGCKGNRGVRNAMFLFSGWYPLGSRTKLQRFFICRTFYLYVADYLQVNFIIYLLIHGVSRFEYVDWMACMNFWSTCTSCAKEGHSHMVLRISSSISIGFLMFNVLATASMSLCWIWALFPLTLNACWLTQTARPVCMANVVGRRELPTFTLF